MREARKALNRASLCSPRTSQMLCSKWFQDLRFPCALARLWVFCPPCGATRSAGRRKNRSQKGTETTPIHSRKADKKDRPNQGRIFWEMESHLARPGRAKRYAHNGFSVFGPPGRPPDLGVPGRFPGGPGCSHLYIDVTITSEYSNMCSDLFTRYHGFTKFRTFRIWPF